MTVFLSTLEQMGFLFFILITGYVLGKTKVMPSNSATVLSKLENNVFIPGLIINTLMTSFTVDELSSSWQYFVGGTVLLAVSIPLSMLFSRMATKNGYERNIFTYALTFSNFGFMGNAVVKAIYPEDFPSYLIFTLPFWIGIYTWGVPSLLIPTSGGKQTIGSRLRAIINPMFISMLIGMILGITGVSKHLPNFASSAIEKLGDCMSPVAMLLTGLTVAELGLGKAFSKLSVYFISVVRLLILPILAVLVLMFIPSVPIGVALCIVCFMAMPLGLNTIVIPKAYDLDTSTGSSMALISHIMSVGTIPLVFMLYNLLIERGIGRNFVYFCLEWLNLR